VTPRSYSAAGGVVVHAGCVLVLDRPSRAEVRLPKGHVRPGEPPDAAAIRETREETGYRDLRLVGDLGHQVVTFEYEGRHIVRTERFYLLRLVSETTVSRTTKDDGQFEVLWLAPDDALARLTYDPEREWVRRALAKAAADLVAGPSRR
jgi:8-oxo-dGTP pyrophosphatase MutT (NUDIX family)